MKKFAVGICVLMASLGALAEKAHLEESFKSPPESARPYTWWHWMNGNVSKSGITKDLETMKSVGIAGFQLFDVSAGIPPGPVSHNSPEFHEMAKFAFAEADRLGLKAGFNNSSGWSSSGGPWITPERSMKMMVWSETQRSASDTKPVALPKGTFRGKRGVVMEADFYRDIAVLAFPTPKDAEYRVENWLMKGLYDHGAKAAKFVPDLRTAPAGAVIGSDQVVDVSRRMDADGNLNWSPKSGEWTVLRFGYISTGAKNKPAAVGGEGLEVDKLNRAAVEFHWNTFVDQMIQNAEGTSALTEILIDSYEVGMQNWTQGFAQEFRKRRGYDLVSMMVALTGRILNDTETTERILWDLRVTVAELMHENYFGYFKEKCREHCFKYAVEPYGSGTFDAAEMTLMGDVVMTEFWQREAARDIWIWTSQIVSSGAMLSGKNVVAAESFTNLQSGWDAHPYSLKRLGDRAFVSGVNRYYFHSFAHQPFDDSVQPGMTFGPYGGNFHRNNTWYPKARGWMDYITRCQFLMQSGPIQADVLGLYGDEPGFISFFTPNQPFDLEDIPGLKFHLGGISSLKDLSVDGEGIIRVTRDGKRLDLGYRMLVMKRARLMRPEHVEKLGELAEQGATIFAPKPLRAPSFSDHEKADARLAALVKEHWDSGLIKTPEAYEAAVAKLPPDCETPDNVWFAHHKVGAEHFYFISNQEDNARDVKLVFRMDGKTPELWNPLNGEVAEAPNWKRLNDGRTEVSFEMAPAGSMFVAFRKPTTSNGESTAKCALKTRLALDNDWSVAFDRSWGPKGTVKFDLLIPWNESADKEIKYYSGSAVYRKTFNLSDPGDASALWLDLGEVGVMAQVKLNGKDLGLLWCPPFRVRIGDAVKAGKNTLEIEVTNTWDNRFIGDAAFPYKNLYGKLRDGQPLPAGSQRKTFTFSFGKRGRQWKHNGSLLPAGLIGPVRVAEVVEGFVEPVKATPKNVASKPKRIYSERFDGTAAELLDGRTLGADGTAWQADPSWKADGVGKGKNAYIPFEPAPGKVYTLSFEVKFLPGSAGWLGWGFMKSNPMDAPVLPHSDAPLSWILLRSNEAQPIETFLGPKTQGKGSHEGLSTRKTTMVLNTTQQVWTVEWLVDGTSIRGPESLPERSIGYIGIGSMGSITANLVSFDLSVSTVE